jgi:hypothetical protein
VKLANMSKTSKDSHTALNFIENKYEFKVANNGGEQRRRLTAEYLSWERAAHHVCIALTLPLGSESCATRLIYRHHRRPVPSHCPSPAPSPYVNVPLQIMSAVLPSVALCCATMLTVPGFGHALLVDTSALSMERARQMASSRERKQASRRDLNKRVIRIPPL